MPNDQALLADVVADFARTMREHGDLIHAMEFLVRLLRTGPIQEHRARLKAQREGIPDASLDEALRGLQVQIYPCNGETWWSICSCTL